MIAFREIEDDDPILDLSPLVRTLDFLRREFDANDMGIPLTATMALKPELIARAVIEIKWPDWMEEDVYRRIKVAREEHYDPLWVLHYELINLRFARHYRRHLALTKMGRPIIESRFRSFHFLTKHLMLGSRRFQFGRDHLMGNWDIWLNVLDMEAEGAVTGEYLTHVLYGPPDRDGPFDERTSYLYNGVLTPLIWSGLLTESIPEARLLSERTYSRTPLWDRYLDLDDKPARNVARH